MAARRAFALVLVMCAAPVAFAAPSSSNVDLAEESDLHFQRAIDYYRKGDFERALEYLLRSNRLVPNRNVAFNIARCYEQLGRYDEAFRHYHDVYGAESDPKGKANAEGAIERIRPRVALLEVETTPPGASIFIDRRDLGSRGQSPQTLALPKGRHSVIVTLDGYESAEVAEVDLVVGEKRTVKLSLERILGAVTVGGEPAGATVRVDGGETLGALPGEFPLPPGQHVLVVEAPGREASRVPVQVEARQTARVEVALRLITGQIVVDGDEAGALIEVDGLARGFTPAVVQDVPVGAHTVSVRLPGYAPFVAEVEVEPRGEKRVFAVLEPLNEVVGASRRVESLDEAPASVTLITGQEIRAFGYETLYDALQGTRGVFGSHDRSYAALGVRGFARAGDYGNRLLVSLDGHTVNDDLLGSSYLERDFAPDLGDVGRIEFVRGPGSALYGTNAFFGVINVVTRDAESMAGPHLEVAHGGAREVRGRVGAGTTFGKDGGAWLSAGAVTGKGETVVLRGVGDDGDEDRVIAEADDIDGGGAMGKVWWGDLTLQGSFVSRDKRIPTGAYETVAGDPSARNKDRRGFVELRYEPRLTDGLQLLSRAYLDAYDFEGVYPYGDDETGTLVDNWEGAWAGAEARLAGEFGDALRVTVGGEGRASLVAELTSRDIGGQFLDETQKVQVFSGFGVIDWRPLDVVSLAVGGRVDHFSTFGTTFNPRATLIVRPSGSDVIKLIAGRAFRAPSPYELRYNDDGTTQLVAQGLEPETVLTTEMEYVRTLPRSFRLIVGVYYNRVSNLVELVTTGEDELLQYQNVDELVSAAGAEIELRREWRQGWFAAANYSYQRARLGDVDDGLPLTNSPEHLAALKVAAPLARSGVTLASRLRFEGPRLNRDDSETDAAFLWDVTLSGEVPTANLTYAVGVRNLLDWPQGHSAGEDIESVEVPQLGRLIFARARVGW